MRNFLRYLSSSLLFAVLGAASLSAQEVVRGPYLQQGTPNSVVVRWRTDVPTETAVRFGVEDGKLDRTATKPGKTTEHIMILEQLVPATKYYYSIGNAEKTLLGDNSTFYITPPVAGTRQPFRFWVVGDSGTANLDQWNVRDAYYDFTKGRHTDAWLMLGDNAYPKGTDEEHQRAVFDAYRELLKNSVVWPTIGNHDAGSAASITQSGVYYDVFTLPTLGQAGGVMSGTEAYYSFDHGNVHFVCLDSEGTDRSVDGAMLTWLRNDVASTRQDWIVAFWHHPPYTKGSHDSNVEKKLIEMRENALPILEEAGVDLVLTGHSHNYERSFLLDGHYGTMDTLTEKMKVDGGDGRPEGTGAYRKPTSGLGAHEGAVYVVAGSSGQTQGRNERRLARGFLEHTAMVVSLYRLGSLVVDIEGNRLDATFLSEKGERLDYFTLIKGADIEAGGTKKR